MQQNRFVPFAAMLLAAGLVSSWFLIPRHSAVSAQTQVIQATKRAVMSPVEYIKVTTNGADDRLQTTSFHIRDKKNVMEISGDDVNGQLQSKIVLSEKGSRVTSIGRDLPTGKLTGNTWTLPKHIAEENERLLKRSLLEDWQEQVTEQQWVEERKNGGSATPFKEIVSENPNKKDVLLLDKSTGMPVKKTTFMHTENGSWSEKPARIEEYQFWDKIPPELLHDKEAVDLHEIPAPIIEDKLFNG